ncbi:glycosyltransferase [Patescibacteria group bacterium]|nr:glycosyltransferase [Patescibacteria group bacterium]
MKIPCSVPILTLNCCEKLQKTLPTLAELFDDVFLVDGNSTDGTQEYARSLGVRVEKQFDTDEPNQRITDFPKVRMASWDKSRCDWLLVLDADEVLTPACVDVIRACVAEDNRDEVHWVRRYPVLPDGLVVKNSPFYAAHYFRLFARSRGIRIADRLVHEKFLAPEGMRHVYHDAAILCPEPSPKVLAERSKRYAILEGKALQISTWYQLIRWIFWYNIKSFFGQLARVLKSDLWGRWRGEPVLPWSYNAVFLAYRVWSLEEGVRAWLLLRKQI